MPLNLGVPEASCTSVQSTKGVCLNYQTIGFNLIIIPLCTVHLRARPPQVSQYILCICFEACLISRDGGKWWSKDHHLVVIKILKNVDFTLKNVKNW